MKITALIACLVMPACAGMHARVETKIDQFNRSKITTLTDNFIEPDAHGQIAIDFFRVEDPAGAVTYSMIARYSGTQWLFIGSGESLEMLIDGRLLRYRTADGSRGNQAAIGGPHILEQALYEVTAEQIQEIAGAGAIKVRLIGRGYAEGEFAPRNLQRVREFLAAITPRS